MVVTARLLFLFSLKPIIESLILAKLLSVEKNQKVSNLGTYCHTVLFS